MVLPRCAHEPDGPPGLTYYSSRGGEPVTETKYSRAGDAERPVSWGVSRVRSEPRSIGVDRRPARGAGRRVRERVRRFPTPDDARRHRDRLRHLQPDGLGTVAPRADEDSSGPTSPSTSSEPPRTGRSARSVATERAAARLQRPDRPLYPTARHRSPVGCQSGGGPHVRRPTSIVAGRRDDNRTRFQRRAWRRLLGPIPASVWRNK